MELKELFSAFAGIICYDTNKTNHLSLNVDVNDLLQFSEKYRLNHLLYLNLKRNYRLDKLTDKNLQILRNSYEQIKTVNTNRLVELTRLSNAFDKAGIKWILLKEYAYDGTYGDLGAVQQNDFDILIQEVDFKESTAVLNSMNYVFHESKYGKSYGEFRYKNPNLTSIDLHIRLMPNKNDWVFNKQHYADMFKESEIMDIQGIKVRRMNPLFGAINMIIHTVLHHNFFPFSKLINFWNYLISKQENLNLAEVANLLNSLGISNLAWFCLKFTEDIIGQRHPLLDELKKPNSADINEFVNLQPNPSLYYETETYHNFDALTHRLNYRLLLFDDPMHRQQIKKWDEDEKDNN